MLFHSPSFLFLFLPIVWLVFAGLKRLDKPEWVLGWIAVSSMAFYAWWSVPFLALFAVSIAANFWFGHLLASLRASAPAWVSRVTLIVAVVLNLAGIVYFKYAAFLLEVLYGLTGVSVAVSQVVLPLAISFYTFEQISYVVDVYRGEPPEKNFWRYVIFAAFFPQTIAGPILHHSEIIPQLNAAVRVPVKRIFLAVGLSLFSIGMFKKVVLADTLSLQFAQARDLFVGGAGITLIESWLMMSAGALEIYFDYSAYSDMAMGLSLFFGIRMPVNFDSPYKATSPIEFWRRWNITLMRFLRDYVYIPLGGSRTGLGRRTYATLVTMAVCGLWHGAGFNYLIWGLVIGAILCTNAWLRTIPMVQSAVARMPDLLRIGSGRLLAYACYVVPLALFMFPDVPTGVRVGRAMLGGSEFVLPDKLVTWLGPVGSVLAPLGFKIRQFEVFTGMRDAGFVAGCLLIIYLLPNAWELTRAYRSGLAAVRTRLDATRSLVPLRWRPTLPWAIVSAVLFLAALLSQSTPRAFFYFQF